MQIFVWKQQKKIFIFAASTWHFYFETWFDCWIPVIFEQFPETLSHDFFAIIKFTLALFLSFYCWFLVLTRIITNCTQVTIKKKSFIHFYTTAICNYFGNKFLYKFFFQYCALFNFHSRLIVDHKSTLSIPNESSFYLVADCKSKPVTLV